MTSLVRVACLQMNSSDSVGNNMDYLERCLEASLERLNSLDILLLPENFAHMPANRHLQYSEQDGDGPVQTGLAKLAHKFNLCIIGGSLAVHQTSRDQKPSAASGKPFARSLVYAKTGERIAHYDKLHLFDIDVPAQDGSAAKTRYRESDSYSHGLLGEQPISTFVLTDIGLKIGLTICYDLRFGELYQALAKQGAQLITVPSAFTYDTGLAHWHTLLRARAIENQVYILAAAQVGKHASGRRTYGHSLIIDPWGEIVAEKEDGEGLLIAEIDPTYVDKLGIDFPVKQHRRLL